VIELRKPWLSLAALLFAAVSAFADNTVTYGTVPLVRGSTTLFTHPDMAACLEDIRTRTISSQTAYQCRLNATAVPIVAPPPPPPTGTVTGLDFPANGSTNSPIGMIFTDVVNRGLPIWGPNNRGITYIWQVMPRQHSGYYTTFFWAHNGPFEWNNGNPSDGSYIGAHPYPQSQSSSGTVHHWEISAAAGDFRTTQAGSMKQVVKGQWYTQALRVVVNGNGTKTATFYTALPSLAPADVIQVTLGSSYGNAIPPAPALTWGDNPWWADYGHERLNGVLRGIKIFNKVLSESDTVTEASSDQLVTTEGQAYVWYMNINPRPDDVTDKSGKGNHPTWTGSARPGLWQQ
jgi:hypothetical protein